MIRTENLTTVVKFGNDERGAIGVTAHKGILTLRMLAKEKQIGDDIVKEDEQELPKIEMEFFSPKSIDVMIRALECIKKNYIPPASEDTLIYAC